MDRLSEDHGIKLGCALVLLLCFPSLMCLSSRSKLAEYLKKIGWRSARRPGISEQEQAQHVLDQLANDPVQARGPREIKERLANSGVHLPRYVGPSCP